MPNPGDDINIVECPRDAWQGLQTVIPTADKVEYLRKLMECGFRRLDAVSFVAPKYVPQMADSERVLAGLASAGLIPTRADGQAHSVPDPASENIEIVGLVVNEQGLARALSAPGVTTIGYPYSVSANFRRQNANMSQSESRQLVLKILDAAQRKSLNSVVYISMAFGNPFGEPWSAEVTAEAVAWLKSAGAKAVSLADTVGIATSEQVGDLYREISGYAEGIELGVHLHSRPDSAAEKVIAAYEAGCRRFDGALTGLGGCPFASDHLVGNIPTEIMLPALASKGAPTGIEPWALLAAVEATKELRSKYARPQSAR